MSYVLLFLWWVGDVWFLRDFGIIGATFHTLSLLILAGLLMDGMLRDIRYLPKVTQLHSDLGFDMNFELQPRALSFQNSHCLHYLVGAGETGQITCKSSPSNAWLPSSPPASRTICTGMRRGPENTLFYSIVHCR